MLDIDSILRKVTRPARYAGGEWNAVVKDWDATPLRLALAYPDVYDIGMSNLGLAILYDILNQQPDVLAERVFAPWPDMEKELRAAGLPLFSLETRHPLSEFDVIGFSLGYELTYTNVLNMLDLAGLPLLAAERAEEHPLVIAGGTAALNPEPLADFIDAFVLGEGEEVTLEIVDLLRRRKSAASLRPRRPPARAGRHPRRLRPQPVRRRLPATTARCAASARSTVRRRVSGVASWSACRRRRCGPSCPSHRPSTTAPPSKSSAAASAAVASARPASSTGRDAKGPPPRCSTRRRRSSPTPATTSSACSP